MEADCRDIELENYINPQTKESSGFLVSFDGEEFCVSINERKYSGAI